MHAAPESGEGLGALPQLFDLHPTNDFDSHALDNNLRASRCYAAFHVDTTLLLEVADALIGALLHAVGVVQSLYI